MSLGHDAITYVAGPEASWTDGMRWRALIEGASALDVRVRRVGPFPPTVKGGVQACAHLLDPQPRAVLAYNDLLAIGVMRGLQARGIRIPDDVSVVGFDDIFGADLVTPGLTTVAAPLRALGTSAVRNLLAVASGARSRVGEPGTVPTRLVVRSSTAQRSRKSTSPALGTTKVSGSAS